jgi:hypothetical protein
VKLLGVRQLSMLLIGTLLLCHGLFGALHLVRYSPECVGDAEHAAQHQAATGAVSGAHEHPADHGTSTGYFAVLVGLLGLLLGLLPKGAPLRSHSVRVGPWSFAGCPPSCVLHQPPHHSRFRCSGSERLFAPVTRAQGTQPEHHT